ncbi:hypothetical protein D3C76_1424320 [compost metagenome]
MVLISGLLVSPICTRATPIKTESRITCSITPLEKAPTKVCGMILRKNSIVPPCSLAAWLYLLMALPSRALALMFMPSPGLTMLTTMRPTTKAMVDSISK